MTGSSVRGRARGVRLLQIAIASVVAIVFLLVAPGAEAQIIAEQHDPPQADDGWQAGTCTADAPTCSVDTPAQFFETAAAHPPVGFTQFIIKKEPGPLGSKIPIGNLRTVLVDLPPGLTVNPQTSVAQCELEPGESPAGCPQTSKVGISEVTVTNPTTGLTLTLPPADVFNIVPFQGEPARFGLSILGNDIFLEAGVSWEGDFHEFFTIHVSQLKIPGELLPGFELARIAQNRLVFEGRAGGGTFITTPSTCFGEPAGTPFEDTYATFLRADSYEQPNPGFPSGSPFIRGKIPPKTQPRECSTIPFEPAIEVDPGTEQTDSPAGATATVELPWIEAGDEQQTSPVRAARVSLPQGMGLNPSAANGLEACTDAQFGKEFGKGTRNPAACPPASRVGSVLIDTPPLADQLTGDVYVGRPLSRDPASGDLYRIFVVVDSPRYGVSARLLGKVAADPLTGRLTTTFDDGPLGSVPVPGLPQVPLKAFRLDFNDGSRAPLTSPPTCGPNATATRMTPWSGNADAVPGHEFALKTAPGGGECAKSMAERPFAPSFGARTVKPVAGAFSALEVEIDRSDGEQELKGATVEPPNGVTAKLAGVRYCPESAIAAAAASAGTVEAATPSCPASSLIGSASIRSGSGPEPIAITGKAFLAGPHNGAPLSLVVVTPATAGPFDLGSVVVRVALRINPETARIQAVSDAIPHVYGGALLDIRSVSVKIDRPKFGLNPTNCAPMAVGGTLNGGGANPLDPAAFSAFPVSAPFQVSGCERLGFKPKLFLRTFGATKRGKNPRLRAVLKARAGDANIGRAAVTLPRHFFVDQSSLSKVCTRVQFAANDCPKNSIYGHARAVTPLLDGPLKGPVYLRSSDNLLPDLVARLRGQVEVHLVGRTDAVNGRIRNTFDVLPDVPVSNFVLTVRGGKKGLLVNSRSLCKGKGKIRAIARFKGQNGKKANMRPKLRTPCGKKGQARKQRR